MPVNKLQGRKFDKGWLLRIEQNIECMKKKIIQLICKYVYSESNVTLKSFAFLFLCNINMKLPLMFF